MAWNQKQKQWIRIRARNIRRMYGLNAPTSERRASNELRNALAIGVDPLTDEGYEHPDLAGPGPERGAPPTRASSVSIPVVDEAPPEEPPALSDEPAEEKPAADPEPVAEDPESETTEDEPTGNSWPYTEEEIRAMGRDELKAVCEANKVKLARSNSKTQDRILAHFRDELDAMMYVG